MASIFSFGNATVPYIFTINFIYKYSQYSFVINVFSFPLDPSIFHAMFNKAKGGETLRKQNVLQTKVWIHGLKWKMKCVIDMDA